MILSTLIPRPSRKMSISMKFPNFSMGKLDKKHLASNHRSEMSKILTHSNKMFNFNQKCQKKIIPTFLNRTFLELLLTWKLLIFKLFVLFLNEKKYRNIWISQGMEIPFSGQLYWKFTIMKSIFTKETDKENQKNPKSSPCWDGSLLRW